MTSAFYPDRVDALQQHAPDIGLPPHPAYRRPIQSSNSAAEGRPVERSSSSNSNPSLSSAYDQHGSPNGANNGNEESATAYLFDDPAFSSTYTDPAQSTVNSSNPPPYYEDPTLLSAGLNALTLNEPAAQDATRHASSDTQENIGREGNGHIYRGNIPQFQVPSPASQDPRYRLEDYDPTMPYTQETHHWQPENYDPSSSRPELMYRPEYDPYTAAASNVLGAGPPQDALASYLNDPAFAPVGPSQRSDHDSVLSSGSSSRYLQEGGYPYEASPTSLGADGDQSSIYDATNYSDPSIFAMDRQDSTDADGSRPPLHRSGTTGSVSLGTRKMKAVDLRAPPFTKEFIDQYRQRIKSDPDPEAHFQYAKYLIDAAKNIGANAPDQKAVRKYRELLVQEALKVIRRLATQGDPYAEAQFFLANCHGTGMLGLQVDHERAYHLYLQAAKQNHSAASYRVAVCNEIGAGTRRELPRAFAFYRKAASLGDTSAMYKLGMVLLSGGLGQPRNPREAVAWLRRAAEQADEDNPHSLHELGLLHENPDSQIVPHDPLYAKNLFTKAAQLGYTQSQYKLGQCYEYGTLTCSVDPRRSIGWYTRAAEKGDAEAELALSGWYLTGSDGVLKQSDSEAYLWARRAANKGLSKAEYAVGYYAEIGIGVKQDTELAKRWYMRAAAQGNKRAMNRLTELKRLGNKRGLTARPTRQQAKDECVIC